MIASYVTGVQHLGLPTNDLKATLEFYQKIGFEIAHQADNEGTPVVFLRLGNVCVETYENGQAVGCCGAIDHVALDVTDVEKAWDAALEAGLTPIEKEIVFLPFWENGVRFFNVWGPNGEKVEFSQVL